MGRPNFVFILADDLGHWTLGCEGNQDAITPHIDRLAMEGMQLRRFYCSSPVCSPARASLLTGQMQSMHGVADWILEEQGLLEDTVVVFTSDNGFNCGHHGIWGKGNGTLPFNMYESSVKVPFIVRYPQWVPPGTLSEAVIGGIDWFSTVLRMAGIPLPPEDIPGRDFLDVLQGRGDRTRETAFLYDEYGDTRMMIRGAWK